jgi:Major Facilitator Superfamily
MANKPQGSLAVILTLGTTETIAWASSYYLPAILARPIAADLGLSPTYVFGALTAALIFSGLIGPRVGHVIDTVGGRGVHCISNLVLAGGLAALAAATGPISLGAAWLVLGIGMGMGLYDAAFATLTRLYGVAARKPITGITLIAGFASTVGWPISAYLDAHYGWRIACLVWAATHLLVALPLNLTLPRVPTLPVTPKATEDEAAGKLRVPTAVEAKRERWAMAAVAYFFAATGFVSAGISTVLPTMLSQMGASAAAAILAGTLVGPSQVAARLVEAGWLSRYHPLVSTEFATIMAPLGVVALVFGGPAFGPLFAIFYGAGNGILTISRGTLPLALFGPEGFGRRVGLLSLPARGTAAVAPLIMGLLVEYGTVALWASAIASLSALLALLLLHAKHGKAHA